MRRSFTLVGLLAGMLLALPGIAVAGTVLFTGSETLDGFTRTASALFSVSGSTLTVTLSNTGDSSGNGSDVPSGSLTGLFFDIPDGVALAPGTATIAAGDLLQPQTCDIVSGQSLCSSSTTNVGGEFGFATGSFQGGATQAVASSGYIPGSSTPDFNGPNLDSPVSLDGPNFGIVAPITAQNIFKPNGGLQSVPLIEGAVVFTFTITGSLLESQISNVTFQYGTSLTQPSFPGTCTAGCDVTPPPPGVPEPSALLMLGPAAAAALIRRRRRPTT